MINIFHGTESAIRSHVLHLFSQSERALWIEEAGALRRYWSGFRQMLPQLRAHLGDQAVEEAISRNRVVAALILGHLRSELTAEERLQLEQLKPRMSSHLSHNWVLDRPVVHGLAAILRDLYKQAQFEVFIPDLHLVDHTTFSLYLMLHRWSPETAPNLYIGSPNDLAEQGIDKDGVMGEYAHERVRSTLETLQAISTRRDHDLSSCLHPSETPEKQRPVPLSLDLLDDDIDGRAVEILASTTALNEEEVEAVMDGIQRAFETFSREIPLRLTMELFKKEPPLTRRQAATLHGIAGLTAHNWQFASELGNQRLVQFLEYHFREALELEDDQVLRLCQLYRLAVTLGRRKKDMEGSLKIANLAVREAQEASISQEQKLYQEIWARNIRAYVHMRRGCMAEAFEDSETSLSLAEQLATPLEKASRDVRFTRTVVADNNQVLCGIAGEHLKLEERTRKNFDLLEQDPETFGGRFAAPPWIAHYRRKHRLDLAIKAAQYGLNDAGIEYPGFRCYFFSQLGDLNYRRGDAVAARLYFDQAEPLRRDLRGVQDQPFLSRSVAAFRAGDFAGSQKELRKALDHPHSNSPAYRAEILAMLALVSAHCGSASEAEDAINQAIDLALEEGVRDSLVRIARFAGAVSQRLGRTADAEEAYTRGLAIADVEGEGTPPSGDLFAILVGLAECQGQGQDPNLILRALQLAPKALEEDSDTWWELPRLISLLSSLNGHADLILNGSNPSLGHVITAASQRGDCASGLGKLVTMVPSSVYQEQIAL
jgi:tetratricopeptide (TPR) repeat protein